MVAQGNGDYHSAVRLIREAQTLAAAAGDSEEAFQAEHMFGDLSRRNRNAKRALEHHRKALDIVDEHRLAASERVRALTGIGMDLVVLGRTAEAQASLEETVRLSRRWGLKRSLAASLFYLGWLHALAGREQDGARCLTECMRIADEHGHIHFFSQEAKVAVPILALCDRLGAGAFVRSEILPLLPARLAAYFEELATGKTYPTDVPLGLPPGRGLGAGLPAPARRGPGGRRHPGGHRGSHRPGARDPQDDRAGNVQQGDRRQAVHLGEDGQDARQPRLPQAGGGQPAAGHPGVPELPAGPPGRAARAGPRK